MGIKPNNKHTPDMTHKYALHRRIQQHSDKYNWCSKITNKLKINKELEEYVREEMSEKGERRGGRREDRMPESGTVASWSTHTVNRESNVRRLELGGLSGREQAMRESGRH